MWLIPVPVFKQRYFSASFYLLCFRKGTFVPNSTSCASAKVLLCFILPPVFQQKYFCASFYLPCFSKSTSVPHLTSRVSAKVLLCLILPPVFQQRYFCASFYLLCFSKGTSVPHSTPCGPYHFLCFSKGISHTPSIAFRHLPPKSARFSYATEGAIFISAQLSSDAVSALRKVWVLIRLWKEPNAPART